jgi:hypothetical protein
MVDDFRILGIEKDSDAAAIKRAFRARAKALHPDLASGEDALARHSLFVELCAAYSRLIGKDNRAAPRPEPAPAAAPHGRGAKGQPERAGGESSGTSGMTPALHADPAYAFYKAGMRIYMSIHPSQWNFDTQRMLNTAIKGSESDQTAIKRKVLELVGLFPKAYYYFGLVLHEYPDSAWAYDAREKMTRIEERIVLYRRIVESFSSWNSDGESEIGRRREEEETNRAMKAERRTSRKGS